MYYSIIYIKNQIDYEKLPYYTKNPCSLWLQGLILCRCAGGNHLFEKVIDERGDIRSGAIRAGSAVFGHIESPFNR